MFISIHAATNCSLHKGTISNQTLPLWYTCIWLLHPAPTSAQDGQDGQQLAPVVFVLPSIIAQRPQLHLKWASPATCAGGVYVVPTSAYTKCTHDLQPCCHCPLQLALVMFFLYQPGILVYHIYIVQDIPMTLNIKLPVASCPPVAIT